jgi:hypothetical protein
MTTKPWECIGCSNTLGLLEGTELRPSPDVSCITRNSNLALTCPKCGQVKIWYSSDPINRAIYNLIDAMVGQFSKRLLATLGENTQRIEKKD